jgi:nicotinamidase-related amidase
MKPKALVLVDFEREWTDENSDYFVGNISDVIQRTNKLIDFCRANGYKIIFTRHIEKGSEGAFAENSERVELISELHKQDSDVLITKYKISPFYETGLEKELEGINQIVVAGILTNLCVRSLIQDAYDRDFEITVIKDCCTAFDEETQEFTFKDLKATRDEIEFLNLDEFIR